MKIKQYIAEINKDLAAYIEGTPDFESRILIATVAGIKVTELPKYLDLELNEEQELRLVSLVERRQKHEPLQYIIGQQEFMSLDFCVNPSVLIPRPETEILVEAVLAIAATLPTPYLVDVGTGSGAIAVSLGHYLPNATIFALDISAPALAVAQQNSQLNHTTNQIHFIQSDLFTEFNPPQKIDIIVSNPPYVTLEEMREIAAEVQQEPVNALYGGTDGLDFYHYLAEETPKYLKLGGYLAVEIGSLQNQAVCEILTAQNFTICQQIKDYAGKDRVIVARFK